MEHIGAFVPLHFAPKCLQFKQIGFTIIFPLYTVGR